jgi:hypothetical protein
MRTPVYNCETPLADSHRAHDLPSRGLIFSQLNLLEARFHTGLFFA